METSDEVRELYPTGLPAFMKLAPEGRIFPQLIKKRSSKSPFLGSKPIHSRVKRIVTELLRTFPPRKPTSPLELLK